MTDTPKRESNRPRFGKPQTDEEIAAKHVGLAMSSVDLINRMIARDEQDFATLQRNVDHLQITVERDVVASSSEDLAPLYAAIEAGRNFMRLHTPVIDEGEMP